MPFFSFGEAHPFLYVLTSTDGTQHVSVPIVAVFTFTCTFSISLCLWIEPADTSKHASFPLKVYRVNAPIQNISSCLWAAHGFASNIRYRKSGWAADHFIVFLLHKEKMWIVGFLLLFIAVLILSTRKAEEHYNNSSLTQQPTTSTTLPIVVRAGVPYAILPDGSPARLSFGRMGLTGRSAGQRGLQELFLGGSLPIKMPVRLTRGGEEPTLGVLRHTDKSVRTVVLDMGTKQLHLRSDRVLHPGEGVPYQLTPSDGVKLEGESSRLGNVSLNIDDTQSVGYAGRVSCGSTTMRLRRTIPGSKTSIGSHDIAEGKHRLIFDIVDSRVLVQ